MPWRRRIYGRGDGRDEADGADRAGDAPTNGAQDNAVTNQVYRPTLTKVSWWYLSNLFTVRMRLAVVPQV
jgi:hypothetical protein